MGFEANPVRVRARYDGHVFVPEVPVDIPPGTVLEGWTHPARTSWPREHDGTVGRRGSRRTRRSQTGRCGAHLLTRLLDTNVFSRYLSRHPSPVKAKFVAAEPSDLSTCAVVEAELRYGAAKSQAPETTKAQIELLLSQFVVLPFDSAAAER